MYEKLQAEDADICTCNVRYVLSNDKVVKVFKNDPLAYKKNNDYLMAKWLISNFMWDKLFKKEVFDGNRFDTRLRTNEDVYLLFAMIYGKKIVSVDEVLYNYLQRPQATSKGAPPSFVGDRVMIINKQLDFSRKIGRYEIDQSYLTEVYLKHFVLNSVITLSRYSENFNSDANNILLCANNDIFNVKNILSFVFSDAKTGLVLLLFKWSPPVCRLVIRLRLRFSKYTV